MVDTHADFREIIADSLSFNIFACDDCFREDACGRHISLELFDSPEHLRNTMLKLLLGLSGQSDSRSVIVAGDDPYLDVLVCRTGFTQGMTCYRYDPDDLDVLGPPIEPARIPCSLVIPYSKNEGHVLGMVDALSRQKVPVSQVIAVIDENPSGTHMDGQSFEFVSISDWTSLKERIGSFRNVSASRKKKILSDLTKTDS